MVTKKKPSSRSEKEALVRKLSSIFWAEFAKGAELPVDHQCFDRAVSLGVEKNMRRVLGKFGKFGKDFELSKACSLRAGKKAKRMADSAKPKMKSIDPDTYEKAFQWVSDSYKRKGTRGPIRPYYTCLCTACSVDPLLR